MEEMFQTTEAQRDNRGPFERALVEWFDESIAEREKQEPVYDTSKLRELQRISEISDAERMLLAEALKQAARSVAEILGRSMDEVKQQNGLRYYAIPFIVASIHADMVGIRNVLDRVLTEQLIFGRARVTPNCDCSVCKVITLLNEEQDHIPERFRNG